jgi:hypothetical protein
MLEFVGVDGRVLLCAVDIVIAKTDCSPERRTG